MQKKAGLVTILVLCMLVSSECFLFDLINFKLGLVSSFFNLFDNHYGTNTKSSYESQGLSNNAWRDTAPSRPPPSYESKFTSGGKTGSLSSSSSVVSGQSGLNLRDVVDSTNIVVGNSCLNLDNGPSYTVTSQFNQFVDGVQPRFVNVPASQDWTYVEGNIGNWRVDRGEVGLGKIYNSRWGNTQVMELDSD